MKDTLSFLVQSLLQNNKINVDSKELDFQIRSHPSYPSLHAITGVLNHFDIENAAIKVPVTEAILSQLPKTFIAQIKIDTEFHFAFVINKGLQYKIIVSNKKNKTVSLQTFLDQFTGIVVGVEKDETETKEKPYTKNLQPLLFGIATTLFVLLFFMSNPSLMASIHFVLSLIGVGISYLIIQHDLGLSSKIIDTFCSQESKTTNCNAVLNSKGATLYKNVKLSDVSLVYFISLSFASLLLSLTNNSLSSLYLIGLAGLPVVLYSIYYQVNISKNWCVLCLGVASVLTLQASLFFIFNFHFSILNLKSSLLVVLPVITTASIWLFINTKLKQEQAFEKLKIKSSKFKRNFKVFNTLLQQSETVDTVLTTIPEIVLGNKNAPLNITIITNPFCGHCKGVHNILESILKQYHTLFNATVRFNINTSNLESDGVLVSSKLLELFHTKGEQKCLEAMHDIYNKGNAKSWLTKWGTADNAEIYADILQGEYEWCFEKNINFTPEILINGKSFPKAYDRSDLKYFIEDLSEACSVNTQPYQLQNTI
ncbi:thioredoxin domain-containing protein [Lacinutrix neustonica]|uniref:Thioredoxin domain-containing protein n=1 Tax=Lacinutrix neustonica TaxID=2980107 RepID=A0A9E8N0J5_9FLAO|nr:vitamin K epoxide reductase family protein [Lacinutrix neustonica]WAC03630.1 thioredoxin domain-containing protein [Lacinutrix neustonica]